MKTILCIFLGLYVVVSDSMAIPVTAHGQTPNHHAFTTSSTSPRLLRKSFVGESLRMQNQDRIHKPQSVASETDTMRGLDEVLTWSDTTSQPSFSLSFSFSMSMPMPDTEDWTTAMPGSSATATTISDENADQMSSLSSSSSTLKDGNSLSSTPKGNQTGYNRLLSIGVLVSLVIAIAATLLGFAFVLAYRRQRDDTESHVVSPLTNYDSLAFSDPVRNH